MHCVASSAGNIVDWKDATWNLVGMKTESADLSEVCFDPTRQEKIIIFPTKTYTFDASVNLCSHLGGKIAVATSNEAAANGRVRTPPTPHAASARVHRDSTRLG